MPAACHAARRRCSRRLPEALLEKRGIVFCSLTYARTSKYPQIGVYVPKLRYLGSNSGYMEGLVRQHIFRGFMAHQVTG